MIRWQLAAGALALVCATTGCTQHEDYDGGYDDGVIMGSTGTGSAWGEGIFVDATYRGDLGQVRQFEVPHATVGGYVEQAASYVEMIGDSDDWWTMVWLDFYSDISALTPGNSYEFYAASGQVVGVGCSGDQGGGAAFEQSAEEVLISVSQDPEPGRLRYDFMAVFSVLAPDGSLEEQIARGSFKRVLP